MQNFSTLSDAIALAEYAHRNQTDKAGLPYIEHPKRVLAAVQARGALPFVQIAAVLHDVTEDTAFTTDHLLDLGFSEASVRLVRLLDRGYMAGVAKDVGVPSDKIVDYYYLQIGRDLNASIIKEEDIGDNTQPWRLSYLEPETQERLKKKYDKALFLMSPYRNPLNLTFPN